MGLGRKHSHVRVEGWSKRSQRGLMNSKKRRICEWNDVIAATG
jgi:hypothetical protein